MKKQLSCLIMGLILSVGATHAADEKHKQQNKMAACNKEAAEKSLKGDERRAFMKECLSKAKADKAEDAAPKKGSKLGACSKEAAEKGLKGEERKQYLSECNKK